MTKREIATELGVSLSFVTTASRKCNLVSLIDYSLEQTLLIASKIPIINPLRLELLKENYIDHSEEKKQLVKPEYLIKGMSSFLKARDHNRRRCCENCIYLIGKEIYGKRRFPFCSFYNRLVHYKKHDINIFWDYCKTFVRSDKKERLWFNAKAPVNLDSSGKIETTCLGIDRKLFTHDDSPRIFRKLF